MLLQGHSGEARFGDEVGRKEGALQVRYCLPIPGKFIIPTQISDSESGSSLDRLRKPKKNA